MTLPIAVFLNLVLNHNYVTCGEWEAERRDIVFYLCLRFQDSLGFVCGFGGLILILAFLLRILQVSEEIE